MEKMKKNRMAVSLTAALGLGLFAAGAQAVNVATDGIGELSYIPYFSVTKGQEEHIKIVNTSNYTVAAKIIFRRGSDSLEVRDFNIILSPYDVWTAKIVPSTNGNAKLITSDKTCTVPDKNQWKAEAGGAYSIDFDTTRFGGTLGSEGYTLVSVMGVSDLSTDLVNSVPYLAKHVGGTPRNCGAIDWGFANALASVAGQFKTPEASLRITSSLVDVSGASAVEVPVTTFANAYNTGANIVISSIERPDETDVSPSHSDIFVDRSATLAAGDLDAPQRALSTTIMANQVIGSYDTTNNQTSNWIVTFPTKKALFQLTDPKPFKTSSVVMSKSSYDEEEETSQNTTRFSPFLPTTVSLPNEVNVVGFSNNNSLKSNLFVDATQGFAKGWMSMSFPQAVAVTSTDGKITYTGMPVIGFEMTEGNGVASAQPLSFTKGIVSK